MGHVSGDGRIDAGVVPPNVLGVGAVAPRREAVRRGRVRAAPVRVGPSAWEHLEVAPAEGLERLASLALAPGGTFEASIREQPGDSWSGVEALGDVHDGRLVAAATGSWSQCQGGVELRFDEVVELGIDEFAVVYRLRRECLVADDASLPDGLSQEYSPCRESTAATQPLLRLEAGVGHGTGAAGAQRGRAASGSAGSEEEYLDDFEGDSDCSSARSSHQD
mmetsp:Transcript_36466/g.79809  ORF Transcript_36466/g.79809 Transcript_36466/m.79809 type:complete len:221 (-) Transcript_36466:65-727(-)